MKLTVYDFDGTIYNGDSSFDFIKFLIKKKKTFIFKLPKIIVSFIKYKLKKIKKEQMKETIFEIFKEFKDIDQVVEEFWIDKEKNIKSFFKDKKNHKNDIIASASPYFLLEPIAKKYKIKDLFASPVNKNTGKYEGINCHGEEKVRLIKEKYPNSIIEEMYSDDAKADKPLLDLANKSFIVKQDNIISYKKDKKRESIIKNISKIYKKYEEIINYLIVGGLTTVVSLVVYYTCVLTFLSPNNPIELQIANIISWIISVLFAYITNRKYVFKSKEKNKVKESIKFVGSRISTLLLDMLTMFIFVTLLHVNDKISKLIAQVLVVIGNYIISKLFVFKTKE